MSSIPCYLLLCSISIQLAIVALNRVQFILFRCSSVTQRSVQDQVFEYRPIQRGGPSTESRREATKLVHTQTQTDDDEITSVRRRRSTY